MEAILETLVSRLNSTALADTKVIPWGCPIPSFGDPTTCHVATLGLNPSNREFVDAHGNELQGPSRRFNTLRSLGINRWSDARNEHVNLILDDCRHYFLANPYDAWFRRLDELISGTNASYYNLSKGACHLDIIPYATSCKWSHLTRDQRKLLLAIAGDTLSQVLRGSQIRLLVLNGSSVIKHFELISGITLGKQSMPDWALPRKSKVNVSGYAYRGTIKELSGVKVNRDILVLGFNHNIQGSFGVTTEVMMAIHRWIAKAAEKVMP